MIRYQKHDILILKRTIPKVVKKVVYNNQRGSPSLAVNLALNEILTHKVSVDIDTP